MVRPVARFRPAARRSTGELVPVFFVERNPPNVFEIWSGTQAGGIVKSLDIYNEAPRNLAPTASKDLLNLFIAHISDWDGETRIYSQSEQIFQRSEIQLISRHVVNGVAYLIALRSHSVGHLARVTFQYIASEDIFGPYYGSEGPVITEIRDYVADAIYDVVVCAVDLESAQVTSGAQVVYQYAATPTGFGSIFNDGVFLNDTTVFFEANETRTPTPVAIANLLPPAHPFKACGASIWSVNPVDPAPTTESGSNRKVKFEQFFTNEVSRNFDTLLGLNTNSERRVISKTLLVGPTERVLELSTYQDNSGSSCALYRDIALPWTDSYSDYSQAVVLDREDVFADLTGLSAGDQAFFLSTVYEPPAGIAPGTSTAGSTLDPSYFMDTDKTSQLALADNRTVALRYWIPD